MDGSSHNKVTDFFLWYLSINFGNLCCNHSLFLWASNQICHHLKYKVILKLKNSFKCMLIKIQRISARKCNPNRVTVLGYCINNDYEFLISHSLTVQNKTLTQHKVHVQYM